MLPKRPIMRFFYGLSLTLYRAGIASYAPFNGKARKWVKGRKGWQQAVAASLRAGERRIWFHCSSVGEFEQARPLIEALREQFPAHKTVVTFFSPSGYEACCNNKVIDHAFYLPADSPSNAEEFIRLVAPEMAIFVKYEFWYHYLAVLSSQGTPTLLVSGAFRPGQIFFKAHGGLFRDMLQCFTWFFLQDEQSASMLSAIGIAKNVTIAGDTRYDRVAKIAGSFTPIPAIERFKAGHHLLIAGSTWPGDEDVLKECLPLLPQGWKMVIVPHEIDEPHIRRIRQQFDDQALLYTALDERNTGAEGQLLVVNTMGMLSRIFAYGDIAFIGGGFQKGGIHNILEPAVFGLPVLFGPVYRKFVEARDLAELHYVFPVNNAAEAKEKLNELIADEAYRARIATALRHFMQEHIGASAKITSAVITNGWLRQ